MDFRTEIDPQELREKIKYTDKVLSLGSCFSEEIGQRLRQLYYDILVNPAGITFNPSSIHRTLMTMYEGNSLPREALVFNGKLWCHPDFHGSFNRMDPDQVLSAANDSIEKARNFVKHTHFVIITLGTAYVYIDRNSGNVVNNCHKIPAHNFSKRLLKQSEIVQCLDESMSALQEMSDHELQFILTLSPVRHIRDGLIENQQSKSLCLLALNETLENRRNAHYFPAYELLLDDLRDYRFYNKDMVHPSDQAVDYIFEKFESSALSPVEEELRRKLSGINKSMNHRAIYPDSEHYQQFRKNLKQKVDKLKNDFPFLEGRL